jgi:hypothetical protein
LIVLNKELYDKTNLIDFYNIYEEENNSNEWCYFNVKRSY